MVTGKRHTTAKAFGHDLAKALKQQGLLTPGEYIPDSTLWNILGINPLKKKGASATAWGKWLSWRNTVKGHIANYCAAEYRLVVVKEKGRLHVVPPSSVCPRTTGILVKAFVSKLRKARELVQIMPDRTLSVQARKDREALVRRLQGFITVVETTLG